MLDGADFIVTSASITIAANQTEACADLPVLDDEEAFEEVEIFEVVLETPPNVSSSSPNPSRVFIIDDDGNL